MEICYWLCFLGFLSTLEGFSADEPVVLPGLTFVPNFNTYSGYLNTNAEGNSKLFYILTESKSNPETDPLIIWFNGGPGASSLVGMFEELGPFFINEDGATLYENPYSWNAKANVLFLESPIGVGFSYNTKKENVTDFSDEQTAIDNYAAILDLFTRVKPEYANRTFFLAGESYAGVFIPMLMKRIVQSINREEFPNKNFQGVAIGNGYMHLKHLMNSRIVWSGYRGDISIDDWEKIKIVCKTGNATHSDDYDYTQFLVHKYADNYRGDDSACGKLINPIFLYGEYNMNQDCYKLSKNITNLKQGDLVENTAELMNHRSTDSQLGYTCRSARLLETYLNRVDVQDALIIDGTWRKQIDRTNKWKRTNRPLITKSRNDNKNTQQYFDYVIQNSKQPNFRILTFFGDLDFVCPSLGGSWFLRDIANTNNMKTSKRERWGFAKRTGGFVQRYTANNVTLDMLTVKGAGHFVPIDRPGPALQMIANFLFPKGIYSFEQYSSVENVGNSPVFSPFVTNVTVSPDFSEK